MNYVLYIIGGIFMKNFKIINQLKNKDGFIGIETFIIASLVIMAGLMFFHHIININVKMSLVTEVKPAIDGLLVN
jgi:hypothetical protein